MDPERGPKNLLEAKQFLATVVIEAVQKDDMKYVWYHYEDWSEKTQSNFDRIQEELIIRINKWAKLT